MEQEILKIMTIFELLNLYYTKDKLRPLEKYELWDILRRLGVDVFDRKYRI